jgi:hypothetical protein
LALDYVTKSNEENSPHHAPAIVGSAVSRQAGSDKICYLIPSDIMDGLQPLSTDPGGEPARPAVPTPETGGQPVEPVTAALVPASSQAALTLPPVLLGSLTPEIRVRVEHFYSSVYEIFQRWVNRPKSLHTRRAYKEGVLLFGTGECSGRRRLRRF